MKLLDWLKQEHGRRRKVSQATGLHPTFIDYIARGKRIGSRDVLARISAATGGEVTVAELLYPDGLPAGAVMAPPAEAADLDPGPDPAGTTSLAAGELLPAA